MTPGNCDTIFACLHCGAAIQAAQEMYCDACGKKYLQLDGIPVLMQDTRAYFIEMIGLYASFISEKEEELSALDGKARQDPHRSAYYKALTTAIRANNQLIQSMLDVLIAAVSPKELLAIKKKPVHNEVFKDLVYLKRDWCGLNAGEVQVRAIEKVLAEVVQAYSPDKNTALVLGSGLGRLAVSLCREFQNVLATDLSFSMLHFFRQIIHNKSIDFYEVNYKNILKDTHAGNLLTASLDAVDEMSAMVTLELEQRLFCFISDVLNLPLAPNSVSAIFSVYFTDVLSFRLMMGRVDKCLKPGGIFVHFGPLGYNFSDMGEMLAGNEIREVLKHMGYTIAKEDIVETNHLDTALSLQQTRFRNWLLVAVKQPVDAFSLGAHTRLVIAGNINYTIEGRLDPSSEEEHQSHITLKTGHGDPIEISPVVLEMIQYFREEGSIEGLINNIKASYDIDDDDIIIESIKDLLQKRILKVVSVKEQYAG